MEKFIEETRGEDPNVTIEDIQWEFYTLQCGYLYTQAKHEWDTLNRHMVKTHGIELNEISVSVNNFSNLKKYILISEQAPS